jgi:hypothetical protein
MLLRNDNSTSATGVDITSWAMGLVKT